jgi:hypothetical protein
MKKEISFEHLGGKKVGQVEREPAVDVSPIGAKKIGTVTDLMHELHGQHGGMVLAPPGYKRVDLPEVPDDRVRIVASDGSVYDVTADDLVRARAIDPDLHVLVKED